LPVMHDRRRSGLGGAAMQLKKLLETWDLASLKIRTPFLEMDWQPKDEDKTAAWELYIELITRAATQGLDPEEGDEAASLKSVYALFPLTCEMIKQGGRSSINFTRIAVVVLNQECGHLPLSGIRASSTVRSMPPPAETEVDSRHRCLREGPLLLFICGRHFSLAAPQTGSQGLWD
jgi:hypothetical protein